MRPLLLLLVLTLALPGCARIAASPVNPLNWFGTPAAAPQAAPASLLPAGALAAPLERRVPVSRVTALQTDPGPDGVLVTATGQAAMPGAFNAGLVETGRSGGTLTLEFRAQLPAQPQPGAQTITSSIMLQGGTLAGITTIVVTSATNSLSARR